ncbi:hypothetical protein ALC56_12234 [Trachymyrmex septentrionalis]|uniref:Uncharacterized protein n=1 Tax=Trachymyrmex septentrionalis TaxID=34720 RepID=A0A195F035_9HYME|nr:hypothetical protein ALC56_12234 [Trachymyrmex septentrionalis]
MRVPSSHSFASASSFIRRPLYLALPLFLNPPYPPPARRLHHHRPSPLLHPFALFLSTVHHTDDHRCCLKEPTPGKSR